MSWSNEFKVGLFVLVALAIAIGGFWWSFDGVRPVERHYRLSLYTPAADGLYLGSPARIAGVDVGSVYSIQVEGDRARVDFRVREQFRLPVDSEASLRTTGILGDRFIALYPGSAEQVLVDGDVIRLRSEPADFEVITQQVQDITEDVAAITAVLRQMVEEDANREAVEATLRNVEALSSELELMARQNRADVRAIVESVRRLSEGLEGFGEDTRRHVDRELDKLDEITDSLQAAMDDVAHITGRVERGEGTIGALVNDPYTVELLNESLEGVSSAIGGFTRLQTEVYYTGRWYMGTQPADTDTFFYGNPLANSGSNTVGILLRPQEDFWYIFEINDHPQGTVNFTEHFFPETGQVYREWVREPNYRFTFMMAKRWYNLGLRLGVKESGGGVGMSLWMFEDRLELQGDVFDFTLGSYPAVDDGLPNIRLLARYEPVPRVYVEAGTEQLFLGMRYNYFTGFAGAGFRFTDDDIRWLFAMLPLGF